MMVLCVGMLSRQDIVFMRTFDYDYASVVGDDDDVAIIASGHDRDVRRQDTAVAAAVLAQLSPVVGLGNPCAKN